MIKKSHKLIYCLFLITILLVFFGCQTEELAIENQSSSNYSIKKINMEEFERRFKAVTTFNKFKSK